MKVKNINGTANNSCSCGSWLDHWKRYSGQPIPAYCAEKSCIQRPDVGAHVQKDNFLDSSWYIVPLCNAHNRKSAALEIVDSVKLVPANVSMTCGSGLSALGAALIRNAYR